MFVKELNNNQIIPLKQIKQYYRVKIS